MKAHVYAVRSIHSINHEFLYTQFARTKAVCISDSNLTLHLSTRQFEGTQRIHQLDA